MSQFFTRVRKEISPVTKNKKKKEKERENFGKMHHRLHYESAESLPEHHLSRGPTAEVIHSGWLSRGINLRYLVLRDAQGQTRKVRRRVSSPFFFSAVVSLLSSVCKTHFKEMTQLGIDGRRALRRVTDDRSDESPFAKICGRSTGYPRTLPPRGFEFFISTTVGLRTRINFLSDCRD